MATSLSLTSSANPAKSGADVTFTATVIPEQRGYASGRVDFFDGDTRIGYVTLDAGVASLTRNDLAAGGHTIRAEFTGDGYAPSQASLEQSIEASAIPTETKISSSANPSVYGAPVTFTVTVTAASVTPTGTVSVSVGSHSSQTLTLIDGKATFEATFSVKGDSKVRANYSANGNFLGSSGELNHEARLIRTSIWANLIASRPNPSYFVMRVEADDNSKPTGKLEVTDPSGSVTTLKLSHGEAPSYHLSDHWKKGTVKFKYVPDLPYAPSDEDFHFEIAEPRPLAVSLTSDRATSKSGERVQFTVTPSEGGTVTLLVNNQRFDSRFAFANAPTLFDVPFSAAGEYTVTATVFTQDKRSAENSISYTVETATIEKTGVKSPTTTTVVSKRPSLASAATEFEVTVSSAGGIPEGTVELAIAGLDGTLTQALTGGVAKFTTDVPVGKSVNVTATYSGNDNFEVSNGSSNVNIERSPTDTSISRRGHKIRISVTSANGAIPSGKVLVQLNDERRKD